MNRQTLLTEQKSPEYVVVLDEPVLRRVVGNPAVMHSQLERLVEASALPNLTLRLLPFTAGAHAGMDGEFTIFSYDERQDPEVIYQDPDVVYVDNIGGGAYIEDPKMTQRYNQTFERLLKVSLEPLESTQLLVDIKHQLGRSERE